MSPSTAANMSNLRTMLGMLKETGGASTAGESQGSDMKTRRRLHKVLHGVGGLMTMTSTRSR